MATSPKSQRDNHRRPSGGSRGNSPKNRNYSQSRNRSSSGNRGSRKRSPRPKVPRTPPPTAWEVFLFKISLGHFGRPAAHQRKQTASTPADANRDRDRDREGAEALPTPAGKNGSNKPLRAPEKVEVTSERLYVGNLSYDAAESDLIDLFNGVGSVTSAEVVSHRRTQRSKGYAFVVMNTVEEARRAVEVLHDRDFMGRKLVVSGAKSQGIRDSEDDDSDSEELG